MSKVMSAVGARAMAADLDADRFSGPDEYEIAATLRAYADMLDRQTVDREAVREKVDVLVCEAASTGWNDKDFGFHEGVIERVTDAILALMPDVKPGPDVSGLVDALEKCAKIVDDNLLHQREKVGDVPRIARSALSTFKGGEG